MKSYAEIQTELHELETKTREYVSLEHARLDAEKERISVKCERDLEQARQAFADANADMQKERAQVSYPKLLELAREFDRDPRAVTVTIIATYQHLNERCQFHCGDSLDPRFLGVAFLAAQGKESMAVWPDLFLDGHQFYYLRPTHAAVTAILANAHPSEVERLLTDLQIAASKVAGLPSDPERVAVLLSCATRRAINNALIAHDAKVAAAHREALANDPAEIRRQLEWQKRQKEIPAPRNGSSMTSWFDVAKAGS
jgi:hypothetical protein